MKIAVIGAGIVGVTTAYELARDGHVVTVFERRGAAAEETSFANAGIIAPGYVTPWAAPGMPRKVLGQLLQRHASIRMTWPLGVDDLRWAWKWYRACQLDTYLSNRAHMRRLAFYSRARLHAIRDDLRLEYDRSDGYMVLLRTDRDLQMVQPSLQVLREAGVAFRLLEPEQARLVEPALQVGTAFVAGVQLPDDEVGNCRQFALLLKNAAQRIGVQFQFNTAVQSVGTGSNPSVQLQGPSQPMPFDSLVMCAGVESARLLRLAGIPVPLVPVYGYSLSASIREPMNAPRSAVMDEHYKVAITRMGHRIRVAGGAELGGNAGEKRQAPLGTLYKVLQDWFPAAANRSSGIQEWKGARPMLPDGPPLVCASGAPGLWLNLGHGSSGWALACGSARALADQIAGRAPDLDMNGFDLARLRR